MGELKDDETTRAFEKALAEQAQANYVLRLFVSGTTPQSARAIGNIHKICEEHLQGHYKLEVIDIYQQPEAAQLAQIIAAPTLIKQLPPPLRKLVGNLADTERVLIGLNLEPEKPVSK